MADVPTITIKLLSGGMAGLMKEFREARELLLGREASADIRLHPTEDSMVGRRHARLFWRDDAWWIEGLHAQGLFGGGSKLSQPERVRDGQVYQLGPGGPEFRVSILHDAVQETMQLRNIGVVDGSSTDAGEFRPRPLRRVEYDPTEVQNSARQESRRAVRLVIPAVVVLLLCAAGAAYWLAPREDPQLMPAAKVRDEYGGSVFRAAVTVRLRCSHPDVPQTEPARYWVEHGSAFVVAADSEWVYALTNYHVFGDTVRPNVNESQMKMRQMYRQLLERWPRDWPAFSARVTEFDRQREAAAGNREKIGQIDEIYYKYLADVAEKCEFVPDDADWRQVVVDGRFTPVEVLAMRAEQDVVLFRFRPPAGRTIRALPLRAVKASDHARMAGRPVHILGYPNVGDLPLKRSADALESAPDFASGVLSNIKPDDIHSGYSIQSTAPINSGNSGGPLIDLYGNVIGINTWGPSKADAEGVSYSVGIGGAMELLAEQKLTPVPPRGTP